MFLKQGFRTPQGAILRLEKEKTYSSHWSPVLSLHTLLTELLLEMLNCRLGAGNAKREQTHTHAYTHTHRFLNACCHQMSLEIIL